MEKMKELQELVGKFIVVRYAIPDVDKETRTEVWKIMSISGTQKYFLYEIPAHDSDRAVYTKEVSWLKAHMVDVFIDNAELVTEKIEEKK